MTRVNKLKEWLLVVPKPKYPFEIDSALPAAGEPLYEQHRASRHSPGGAKFGQLTPAQELGSDAHRVDAFSEKMAADMNTLGMEIQPLPQDQWIRQSTAGWNLGGRPSSTTDPSRPPRHSRACGRPAEILLSRGMTYSISRTLVWCQMWLTWKDAPSLNKTRPCPEMRIAATLLL
jgi:hypothetical protein